MDDNCDFSRRNQLGWFELRFLGSAHAEYSCSISMISRVEYFALPDRGLWTTELVAISAGRDVAIGAMVLSFPSMIGTAM